MVEGELQNWVGRRERALDRVSLTAVGALAATLGTYEPDPVPPLRHWLHFLPLAPKSEIGPDGHPRRGGFLPPIDLERRMWAGGRLSFFEPMRLGDRIERESQIVKVSEKTGGAGSMVFVTVRHTVSTPRGVTVEEEQDLVFIAMPTVWRPPPLDPAPTDPDWREAVKVDPVMLFRFSAVTFNGHRIHYDRPYATEVEKYPGLVVHGPLQAILLLDAARRHAPGRAPARFSFRAVRPMFDHDALNLLGRATSDEVTELCTANADGHIGMRAAVTWAA